MKKDANQGVPGRLDYAKELSTEGHPFSAKVISTERLAATTEHTVRGRWQTEYL